MKLDNLNGTQPFTCDNQPRSALHDRLRADPGSDLLLIQVAALGSRERFIGQVARTFRTDSFANLDTAPVGAGGLRTHISLLLIIVTHRPNNAYYSRIIA